MKTTVIRSLAVALFTLVAACGESSDTDAGTDTDIDLGTDVEDGTDTAGDPVTDEEDDGDVVDEEVVAPACEPGTRDGPVGASNDLVLRPGVLYNVRTPELYDPTVAYPLIMVYAPAGGDAGITEAFTGLTPPALAAGFIIAYADHIRPSSVADVIEVGTIPGLIAARWCVDVGRIYLTGHSDGGSVASLLIIGDDITPRPAAIAPSAAGVNAAFLASQPCPAPIPVMVMHSSRDTLFPGYGAEAAAWWVGCNGCDPEPLLPLPDGCLLYTGCTDGVEVRYCEGTGSHGSWPPLNASIIAFFELF